MKENENQSKAIETLCVHAGMQPEAITGAVIPPIFQTSTYVQNEPGLPKVYDYSRAGNPTRTHLEEALAALEEAKFAYTFSSGLAAIQVILQLLNPGDHVIVCDDVYGGTGRMMRKIFAKYNIEFSFVDLTDVYVFEKEIEINKNKLRMVWIESPTNPLLKVIDIEKVSARVRNLGALVVVDNTFATPIFQRPLKLGADIVIHSTTKYIGGHSDVIGGCVMTSDAGIADHIKFLQYATGSVNAPFEAFLILRSIKTLHLRMERHFENSSYLAKMMYESGYFQNVYYPGLESHEHFKIAQKQMSGFSGMITVRMGCSFEKVKSFLKNLKIFQLAESLGGVESLVNHPATMTHASVPEDMKTKLGIDDGLVRFSVGIENVNDLWEDILQAFKQ